MNTTLKQPVRSVIYGNRDFFPDALGTEERADLAKFLQALSPAPAGRCYPTLETPVG